MDDGQLPEIQVDMDGARCAKSLEARKRGPRDEKAILELTERVRQVAFALHAYHRHGHTEKIYEN